MATSEIINKNGIVLRSTSVKDADAMILAINEEGFFSFYSHGAKKLTSKFGASTTPLTYASFTLRKSSSGSLTLSEASNSVSLMPAGDDLVAMSIASVLLEITTVLVQEDEAPEVYPYLKAALDAIAKGSDPYCAGLVYFAHVLNTMGIGLTVDGCVSCGAKKDIVALSFSEGGFICRGCLEDMGGIKTPLERLKIYRYIFKAPAEDIGRVGFEGAVGKSVFAELNEYLDSLTGTHIKAIGFLEQI